MRLIIRDNEETASLYVANYIIERIKHFAPTPANPFVFGLPTGSSPLGVYRILTERYKAGEVWHLLSSTTGSTTHLSTGRYRLRMLSLSTW
jgi:6-phosphogluconolactonase/glucosamine-6-phosphate isomerase/deaminase